MNGRIAELTNKRDKLGNKIYSAASVDDIPVQEFISPSYSYELPEIRTAAWLALNLPQKKILLKKNIMPRNITAYPEMVATRKIALAKSLYENDYIIQAKPKSRPHYYSLMKNGDYYYLTNIDTDPEKEYFEIVDWRMINGRGFDKMKRQNAREGGQSSIMGVVADGDQAAALSVLRAFPPNILLYAA